MRDSVLSVFVLLKTAIFPLLPVNHCINCVCRLVLGLLFALFVWYLPTM